MKDAIAEIQRKALEKELNSQICLNGLKKDLVLTYKESQLRAELIKHTKYCTLLVLHSGEEYLGHQVVEFELVKKSSELYLDCNCTGVIFCQINETKFEALKVFSDGKLHIPEEAQIIGKNRVTLVYLNKYATDSSGIHRFVDPEDQEVYLHTCFEPFAANKFLPCFDQPNLKATFQLTTLAPKSWAIVTNELESLSIPVEETEKNLKDKKIPDSMFIPEIKDYVYKEFKTTAQFSTYLMACMAGPYTCVAESNYGKLPLRIFSRNSLQKYVKPYAEEFFDITKKGIQFYEEHFGQPFPFSKLDQIYCPELDCGAMENVGAITYTESYVFKDPPTAESMLSFAETILHEVSHMWFGNLVTMDWWNGLWLNESFATFIANLCLEVAPGLEKYRGAWVSFHSYKGYALGETLGELINSTQTTPFT